VYDPGTDQTSGFYVFPTSFLGKGIKTTLLAGDYNGDGQDELFVTAPGQHLIAWSIYPVRRLAAWDVGSKKNMMLGLSYE
jgi:hypothetical protein